MAEIWKPVPSYPGVMASNQGRILLPPRYAALAQGGYRAYLPVPVVGTKRRSKVGAKHVYMGLWTRFYGNIKIHQAVCEAFHGRKPFDNAVVIHLDEDALNNRPENLKWGTQKENLNAPGFREQCRQRIAQNSPRAKWLAKRKAA